MLTLEQLFNQLNKNNLHLLDDFYAAEITFIDPVGEIRGLISLKDYFAKLYLNVQEISFEITATEGNRERQALQWIMHLTAKGLNGGKPIHLDGSSFLHFKNERCVYHRDYYDMGAFIYERIPLLKYPVLFVKQRLSH